jgi:hypothetical protein
VPGIVGTEGRSNPLLAKATGGLAFSLPPFSGIQGLSRKRERKGSEGELEPSTKKKGDPGRLTKEEKEWKSGEEKEGWRERRSERRKYMSLNS